MQTLNNSCVEEKYPFVAPELIPFIAPLRVKIKEHQDWLQERGYSCGIGPEAEYRRKIGTYQTIVSELKRELHKEGLYYSSELGHTQEYGVTGFVLETRGKPQEDAIAVCDNVYAIRRDLQKVAAKQPSHGALEIASEHYHVHLLNAKREADLTLIPLVGAGLIAISDIALPLSVPLTYLMKPDGKTKEFSITVNKDSSHRIKKRTLHRSLESLDTIEQRANLKGSEALPEIAVCRILGGIRLGLSVPELGEGVSELQPYSNTILTAPRIPFLPRGRKWEEYYREKLNSMQKSAVIEMCYGVEAIRGLSQHFINKLEQVCADLSLKQISQIAQEQKSKS